MDKEIVSGVTISTLPPEQTGFQRWSRDKAHTYTPADSDRGNADWVIPEGVDNNTVRILYVHGGALEWYSPQDVYRPVTSRLALATGMPVFAIDYRLAPEFRWPAQMEDALQAIQWLAENGPEGSGPATGICLAGDSAGGGVVTQLAMALRDGAGPRVPVLGLSLVSPMLDWTCSGASYTSRRWQGGAALHEDPVFQGSDPTAESLLGVQKVLGLLAEEGSIPPDHPSISTNNAQLHDLPPVDLHVGDAEVMLSDSEDFAAKAQAAGTAVQLTVYPKMWHVFTQYSEGCGSGEPLIEAVLAIQRQAAFLKQRAAAF